MLNRLFMIGANHRLGTFLFLTLITVCALLGVPRLKVDTGFDSLVPDSDPNLPYYKEISREFGTDNRTIVYVRDSNLWTPEKLAALEKLHYTLDRLEFIERVEDLFTLRSIRGDDGRIESRAILSEAPPDQETCDQARKDIFHNPLLRGNFISKDGSVTAIILSIRDDGSLIYSEKEINRILENAIQNSRSRFQEIFQVGPCRINEDLREVLFHDLKFLGPLSAVILVLGILFFIRSFFAALMPVITSGLSLAWTFGMMGWTGIPINILSAMLPSLVIVIGSTEDTHMISSYFNGVYQSDNHHRVAGTGFMIKHMGVPVLLTVLTTAMGFASNIFSGMVLIRDFAISATFAMLANGIITMLFIPMLLSIAGPIRSGILQDKEKVTGLPGFFVKLTTKKNFSRAALIVTALSCIFFIYHLSNLYVTNDPLSYFDDDHPVVRDIEKIQSDLSGIKFFFITLESNEEGAFLEPDNIDKLVRIENFMEKQGIFDQSISLADHLSLINREFHGGDEEYYKIPGKAELVAQYLLFFHRRDLESYISNDFRRANIVVRHSITDSNLLNGYIHELREVILNICGTEIKAHVVGKNLMINAASESLMIAQVKSLFILLCVIFLIMSVMFTSFKGGIIALIPNLVPIILMFGLMGVMGLSLNPGTAMVAVIAIGIAIDGTIHLFSRYTELCRRTADYKGAVSETILEESTPMVATYIALALGFGILIFSDFTLIAQFGALSAATMLFALLSNLLITPIIMLRVRLIGLYQILSLSMHRETFEKSPLFQGMTGYQIRKAILISELNEFQEGALLIEQGTYGRNMYLILSGQVEIVRRSDGISKQIAVLGPGQVFGEVGYIKEIHRTADVKALTDVETLRFDYKKIRKDLKFFPHIIANINFNISCILGERLASVMNSMAQEMKKKYSQMETSRDEENTKKQL